jgi:hypothetical protein
LDSLPSGIKLGLLVLDLPTLLLFRALQFVKCGELGLVFALEGSELGFELGRRPLLLFRARLDFERLLLFEFDFLALARQAALDFRSAIFEFGHFGFLKLEDGGLLLDFLLFECDFRAEVLQAFGFLVNFAFGCLFVLLEFGLDLHKFFGIGLQLIFPGGELGEMRFVLFEFALEFRFLFGKVFGFGCHFVTDCMESVDKVANNGVRIGVRHDNKRPPTFTFLTLCFGRYHSENRSEMPETRACNFGFTWHQAIGRRIFS